VCRREVVEELGVEALDVFFRHHAFAHETRAPDFAWARMRIDELIELRLCEARFVRFVVAPPAVADEIDEDVLSEGCSKCGQDVNGRSRGVPDCHPPRHRRIASASERDVLIDLVGYRRWGHNETDRTALHTAAAL